MSSIPISTQVEILRALATGREPAAVAGDLVIPVATVQAIADALGWPDLYAISAAADRLERRVRFAQHQPRHDPVVALLQHGRRARRRPTRELADRCARLLARLADELRDEQRTLEDRARSRSAGGRYSAARAAGLEPTTVRAWALATGVECPHYGKVPRRVVEAYQAAHPEGAAA